MQIIQTNDTLKLSYVYKNVFKYWQTLSDDVLSVHDVCRVVGAFGRIPDEYGCGWSPEINDA